MVLTIAKTFDFDAAHWLPEVPEGHKCRRMHGHTYRVEIAVRSHVRKDGMVLDYADIEAAWGPLHALLDHRLLNEIPGLENPTTENLACYLGSVLRQKPIFLYTVTVFESATSWCKWST